MHKLIYIFKTLVTNLVENARLELAKLKSCKDFLGALPIPRNFFWASWYMLAHKPFLTNLVPLDRIELPNPDYKTGVIPFN